MDFSKKLQELRNKKGLTQEELGNALYVSRTAVSKWESGRGYPNIDSLKAIAKFFDLTVDELLSGEELLTLAQEENKQKVKNLRFLVFGLLDISVIMFFFLPFFGQKINGVIHEVSLLSLSEISPYLKIVYLGLVAVTTIFGLLTLTFQNCTQPFWVQNKIKISLILNALGVLLFIISLQPYAAAYLFVFLLIKVLTFAKKQ